MTNGHSHIPSLGGAWGGLSTDMQKSLHTAIDFIRHNGLTGYEVLNENRKDSYVFRYNPSQSPDENLERLRTVMAITPGQWFTLVGWTTNEKNRVQYRYEFANDDRPAAPAAPAVQGISRDELAEQIKLAEARVEQRYRLRDLERRERELADREREFRREKESAIGIAVQQLGKFLRAARPAIAGLDEPPTRQVTPRPPEGGDPAADGADPFDPIPADDTPAATVDRRPATDDPETDDPATAELEDLLTRWAAADPDWHRLLRRVVEMAEGGNQMYTMAKGFIL